MIARVQCRNVLLTWRAESGSVRCELPLGHKGLHSAASKGRIEWSHPPRRVPLSFVDPRMRDPERGDLHNKSTALVECDGCGYNVPGTEARILYAPGGRIDQAICDDCWPDVEATE